VAAAPFDASAQATGLAIKCINNTTNPLSTALSYFPPNMRITTDGATAGAVDVAVAAGFTVHYDNTFKLVKTICGKYQPAACQTSTSTFCCRDKTYVLTLCGAAKPTTFANGTALPASATHFTIPLTAVATAKGGAVPFMELLGLLDKIAVVDPQTIHSPCLQKLEEDMVGAGATSSPKANWTKLIAEHPTVTGVWTDSFGTGSSSTDKDIVFDGSADASGVLGRAEWIKYMSLFFNEEDKANLYFANEQKVYKATEQALVAVKGTTTKSCAWVTISAASQWGPASYSISFATYKVELCKSAGLVAYVNTTLQDAGTSKQAFNTIAEFHKVLHTIDVVIDESYFSSPSTTVKADVLRNLNITGLNKPGAILLRTDRHVSDKHSKIRPKTTGTVYENVDWLESAVARPALVLQDFAAKVWGVAKSPAPAAGCSQYFRDVLAGEMPIVNGKETCAKFEAAEKEGKCITNAVNTRFISSGVTATSGVGVSYTVVVSSILALVAATLVM
jgi:hypothetical protein